jgi:hypothetical protein
MTVPPGPQDCFADEAPRPDEGRAAATDEAAAVPEDDERWVAFVRADDTTGTIAALAGVFSARGVSIGSLATGHEQGSPGLVVVTFRTGERRQRLLARTVERLPMVRGVVVRRGDDLGVRAAGVVRLPPGASFRPPAHALVRWSGDTAVGEPLLVEGALVDVEAVVTAARAAGATADALVIQPSA